MFFLLTTAAGAALWAAQLEQDRLIAEGVASDREAQGHEEYADNPV